MTIRVTQQKSRQFESFRRQVELVNTPSNFQTLRCNLGPSYSRSFCMHEHYIVPEVQFPLPRPVHIRCRRPVPARLEKRKQLCEPSDTSASRNYKNYRQPKSYGYNNSSCFQSSSILSGVDHKINQPSNSPAKTKINVRKAGENIAGNKEKSKLEVFAWRVRSIQN